MADKYECKAFGQAFKCPWTGNMTGRCSFAGNTESVVDTERCSQCKLTIEAVLASVAEKEVPVEKIPKESEVFKMHSEGYECAHKGGSEYSLVLPERDLKLARMFKKFAGRKVRITIEEAEAWEDD